MILKKFLIEKDTLNSIPQNERVFFVQTGNILTELMILHKILHFSSNHTPENEILSKAQSAQTLFLTKLLTGKLFECWEFLSQKYFNGAPSISSAYEGLLNQEGKEALSKLKQYFRRARDNNPIHKIRNTYAFHYSQGTNEIDQQIQKLSDSEKLELYFAPGEGNCLYYMSQVLSNLALLHSVDSSDMGKAMWTWLQDIYQTAGWFISFFQEIMLIFGEKYLGEIFEEVEVPEPPNIAEVKLPYFVKKGPD